MGGLEPAEPFHSFDFKDSFIVMIWKTFRGYQKSSKTAFGSEGVGGLELDLVELKTRRRGPRP
jgi:hypothetical protein